MVEELQLTNHDRCDSCGSQAYVRILLADGYDLVFCGHHWLSNKDSLLKLKDLHVYSELEKLISQN